MPAITAANVAVTMLDVGRKVIEEKRKRNRVKIVFGDGALTYPAGGVPMPALGVFGFVRLLDGLLIYQSAPDDALIYKYDAVNNTIRIWTPSTGAELAAPPASNRTLFAEAIGW